MYIYKNNIGNCFRFFDAYHMYTKKYWAQEQPILCGFQIYDLRFVCCLWLWKTKRNIYIYIYDVHAFCEIEIYRRRCLKSSDADVWNFGLKILKSRVKGVSCHCASESLKNHASAFGLSWHRKTCGWKLSCHKIDLLFCGSKSVLGQISFIAHVWRLSVFCIVAETVLMFHTCETALMFHTLWSERDLDFVFSPNFNSLWLNARAYGFLRWCRRAKKIIHIETEASVKHQNRLHLLVKENHMVHL